MSVAALTWAFDQDLKPATKVVLLALADACDDEWKCWPSINTLARKSSCSKSTVRRVLAALVEGGVLKVEERHAGSGRQTSNLYSIQRATMNHHDAREGVNLEPSQDDSGEGVSSDTPEGVSSDTPGTVRGTARENHQGEDPMVGFDLFWSAYPKKVGKAACRAKWKSKKCAAMWEAIVDHVKVRKHQDAQWQRGYIQDPLTFLNQERWEDEYEVGGGRGDGNRGLDEARRQRDDRLAEIDRVLDQSSPPGA